MTAFLLIDIMLVLGMPMAVQHGDGDEARKTMMFTAANSKAGYRTSVTVYTIYSRHREGHDLSAR